MPPLAEGSALTHTLAKAVTPAPVTTKRADAPLVLPYKRGSVAQALAAVESHEERQASRNLFEDRAVAKSTLRSRHARLKVWNKLAEKAGVQGPLTAHAVKTVVGALLRANFRSAAAYFSAAKRDHIERYKSWDSELDLIVAADVSRACKRGLGPPSRSSPFPILSIASARENNPEQFAQLVPHASGPLHPWPCAIIATWGMFREIEIANTSLADVRYSRADKTLTIVAPASKADISALGASITLVCTCSNGLSTICPFCIGLSQLNTVLTLYKVTGANDLDNIPLFPSPDLTWCSKEGMIQAITTLASAAGKLPHTRRGAECWGGHAFRRGGAHLYAALGFAREDIKAVARHTSNAIDGYLEGADLQYVKRLLPSKLGSQPTIGHFSAALAPPFVPRLGQGADGPRRQSARMHQRSWSHVVWLALVRFSVQMHERTSCARFLREVPPHAFATGYRHFFLGSNEMLKFVRVLILLG